MANKSEDFGRLEDAMLYQVLPRVRRSDLSERSVGEESAPPKALKSKCSSPALPHFPMLDSVPSVRIAARPPVAKFRVKCTNDSGGFLAADDVIEYTSEPVLACRGRVPNALDSQLDAMLAAVDSDMDRGDRATSPSTPPPYAFLREGARPPRTSSSLVFFALIAIAVIAMSIVALAVLVPHGDWALIQG